MILPASWTFRFKPVGWAILAVLATTFGVSAWMIPGKSLVPVWHGAELSTVLPARIKPSTTFTVGPELPGTIVTVLVSAGAQVRPGQILATLDSDELNAELDRAERRVRFAESRRAAVRPGTTRTGRRLQTERYQAALRANKAARERLAMYAGVEQERALQQAKGRTAQIRSLVDQQLATAAELDEALARERDALAALKAAREHRSRLRQEVDAAEAEVNASRAGTDPAVDTEAVAAAELELEDARESLRQVRERARARNIEARRGGTVLRADVHAGDRVTAGTPLFQIADLSELNFEVPVSAGIAEQVRPGRQVVVRIPTDPPRTEKATVSSVLLSADQDRASYIVRITIPNPNPAAILAGLEGAVEFPHLGSQWKRRASY